ncbi:MAG: flavoprotein [Thermogemmata sp.]|nr:flavoprotein [Thermogemmata sp.]
MARVLLGVTGSVAALKTPVLAEALVQAGHAIQVLATEAALYFFAPEAVPPGGFVWQDQHWRVLTDVQEWPGRTSGRLYQRGEPVLHIELRRWADLLLIAPLDAHTLAKLAVGLCDNCLTCVWRAWDWSRPVVLAPAMNTLMWEHPWTCRHLQAIGQDAGLDAGPPLDDALELINRINAQCPRLRVVPPVVKTLACGDTGLGAMAEIEAIVAFVQDLTGGMQRQAETTA